jgi:hypothetical protein
LPEYECVFSAEENEYCRLRNPDLKFIKIGSVLTAKGAKRKLQSAQNERYFLANFAKPCRS